MTKQAKWHNYAPSEDLDQPGPLPILISLVFAVRSWSWITLRTQGSFMWTVKTWMPRLIWVFAGCTGHFVGFVMLWFNVPFSVQLGKFQPNHICFDLSLQYSISHFWKSQCWFISSKSDWNRKIGKLLSIQISDCIQTCIKPKKSTWYYFAYANIYLQVYVINIY